MKICFIIDKELSPNSFAFLFPLLLNIKNINEEIEILYHLPEKNYDLIFCTSSRYMTAFLGARVSKKIKSPLYTDIRDIFLDALPNFYPNPPREHIAFKSYVLTILIIFGIFAGEYKFQDKIRHIFNSKLDQEEVILGKVAACYERTNRFTPGDLPCPP